MTNEILNKYPNLSGILDGRISGAFREWPLIKPELKAFTEEIESKLQAGRVPPYIVLAMEAALKAFIDEWGRKLISFEVLAQAEKAYNEYQLHKKQEALQSAREKGLV